jgi:hypothetical protein
MTEWSGFNHNKLFCRPAEVEEKGFDGDFGWLCRKDRVKAKPEKWAYPQHTDFVLRQLAKRW